TRQTGQRKRADFENLKQSVDLKAALALQERIELQQLKKLKKKIERSIENNAALKNYKAQLLLDITSEGLRIQIVDERNRPMFAIGKAELQPYTREILREIGKTLNDVSNKISLSGHTDATPYPSGEKS